MRNKSLSTLVLGVISGVACGMARMVGVFCLPALLTGCLEVPQTGVNGGTLVPVTKLVHQADRVYTMGTCRRPDGSVASPMQGSEYEWRKSGPRSTLYEHRPDEPQGRLIDNGWQDATANHYFVWMAEANGFEYVVPKDEKQSGMVRKYVRPEVHAERARKHTIYRPAGQPEEICELQLIR